MIGWIWIVFITNLARFAMIRVFDSEESDFAAVCRIYVDAKRDELACEDQRIEVIPLREDARILAAFRESDVIVHDDDGVVGFAAIFDGQLRALFVHSSSRGKGVGRALLSAALARSPAGLSLHVAESNLNARQFYERSGFVLEGRSERHYNGCDISYVKMSCSVVRSGEVGSADRAG
ncbi:MAG TPA: GNAT family N-acetyltransferase [Duganella sp.]|nr:GNAT family N-acetyltransferase [Duganella sp.]